MADKPTQLVLDALTRAAADPAGVPLFGSKAEPGLFPPTAAAKPAARRAVDEGLLRLVRTEAKGRQTRELYAATEKGLAFLLEQVSPKQVLEDFVRVLEEREGQVGELLTAARGMADSLAGLRAVVARVLPRVEEARAPTRRAAGLGPAVVEIPRTAGLCTAARPDPHETSPMTTTAVLDTPAVAPDVDDLAGAILARLADWSGPAGQDCPLPELYRSLACREAPPTVGAFHDALRQLHADNRIYLHPWTGPLYALPEPTYALLAGHNVAYYVSAR